MNKKVSIIGICVLAVIAFITSFMFNSCKKDNVKNCDRTCFLGDWTVKEDCGTGDYTYDASIIAFGSDPSSVSIKPFFNTDEIDATVNGQTLSFSNQTFGNMGTVSGSATLSDDKKVMTMTFKSYINGFLDKTCSGTWTKK